MHDHSPQHGGVVAMAGMLHLEAVAFRDGRIRVYLTDLWRRPFPPSGTRATVTVDLPDGPRTLPLAARADMLEARASPLEGSDVRAHVRLERDGGPVELHFVLPLTGDAAAAGAIQATGCVSPSPRGDVEGRRPRCTFRFPLSITTIAVTADGSTAVIGAMETATSAWRLPAGTFVSVFAPPPPLVAGDERPHEEGAAAIAVGRDGREAAAVIGQRLFVYGIETGRLLRELTAVRGVLGDVAWSPDGTRLLITTSFEHDAHLISPTDGSDLGRLGVWRHGGAAVAFAPDGELAAVGTEAGPIALFDLATDHSPVRLSGPTQPPRALAFAGTRLVAAGDDRVLRVWELPRGTLAHAEPAASPLTRLAAAPDGRLVASADVEGVVRLHDVQTGLAVETLSWHRSTVNALAWAGSGLLSGDAAGEVALWDLSDRARLERPGASE